MTELMNVSLYKKKMRIHVSKCLSIVKGWDLLRHFVAEHIAGEDYSAIPFLVDTLAYQLGHIFVQEPTEIQCFCAAPKLKILGPLRDFVIRGKTDRKWLNKNLHPIKSTGDDVNFRVEIGNGKQTLRFRAYDCFFLNKAPDMSVEGNVTIDRSSHEDLPQVEWFGLITGVVAAANSNITIVRNHRERSFFIGEEPHTILLKYEICKMNDNGTVTEISTEKIESKWLPLQERDLDCLPITKFVSQSNRVKS